MTCYVAFDIGFRNFAYTIMTVNDETGEWDVKLMKNVDFVELYGKTDTFWIDFHNYLLGLKSVFENCQVCLIEKQMGFGNKVNYKAIQMASQLLAHFLIVYPSILSIEYPSTQKTKMFDKHLVRWKDRKDWSVQFTTELFALKEDTVCIEWLETYRKKDDICDTILMILAYNIEKKKITIDRK